MVVVLEGDRMKTLGLSALIGVVVAGILIYLVEFQNPASKILVTTICVGATTSAGALLGKLFAPKRSSDSNQGTTDVR